MEYKKFRVKTTVKSFRDLEIYKRTTALCAELFSLQIKDTDNKQLETELDILRELSKYAPKYIAESYGDRYSDRKLGISKLEKAAQIISDIIAKLDLINILAGDREFKDAILKIIRNYQIQRRKVINLKRVWSGERRAKLVSEKYGISVSRQTLMRWLDDYREYLPFLRMREFAEKKYDRRKTIEELRLFHGQIYDFKYHRAKTDILLEESFRHYKFRPLRDFLELVGAEGKAHWPASDLRAGAEPLDHIAIISL